MPTQQKSIGQKTLVEGRKVADAELGVEPRRSTTRKAWIGLALVVFVLVTGASLTIVRQSHASPKETPPTTVATKTDSQGAASAGTAPTSPGAADAGTQQLVDAMKSQLDQAMTSGGQPTAITPEQAEAMLRAQLAQLGIR